MSFPKIPNINPQINIKFEDAINLLLASVAMEEVSISKLMDAETSKILCVLKDCEHPDCKHKDSAINDMLKINKSVDNAIKSMIKLQMLLQFKLDNIKELLPPCTSSTTTTSTSTSTTTTCTKTTTTKTTSSTTTTHTTTCTTSTCSTTTRKECNCGLTGNGKGRVLNCCDEYYNRIAVLHAFLFCCDTKNRTVRYSVENDVSNLRLHASGYRVKVQYPHQCFDKLIIYGKGHVEKHIKCSPDISGYVDFILTVCKKIPDNLEFRMEIQSESNPHLFHDSGFVQVKNAISDLRLIICC